MNCGVVEILIVCHCIAESLSKIFQNPSLLWQHQNRNVDMNRSRLLLILLLQVTSWVCGVPELWAQGDAFGEMTPAEKLKYVQYVEQSKAASRSPKIMPGLAPIPAVEAVAPPGFPPLPQGLEWQDPEPPAEAPMLQGHVYGMSERQFGVFQAAERLLIQGRLDDAIGQAEKEFVRAPTKELSELLATAYKKKGDSRLAQFWMQVQVWVQPSMPAETYSTQTGKMSVITKRTKLPTLQSASAGIQRTSQTEQSVKRLLKKGQIEKAIELSERTYLCRTPSPQLAQLVMLGYQKKKQTDLAQMWGRIARHHAIESASASRSGEPSSAFSKVNEERLCKLIVQIESSEEPRDNASKVQLANCHAELGNLLLERAYDSYQNGNENDSLKLFANAYLEQRRCLELTPTKLDSARRLLEICRIALALRPRSAKNRQALASAYILNRNCPLSDNAGPCKGEFYVEKHR